MSEQNHYIYEFGPFRLDARKRLLRRGGEIVPLKPKAFDTLLALVEGSGHILGKDELMRRVWPGTAVEEGNLTLHISALRRALGDDPRRHEYIVTIPGEGYQFVAGVRATFDELEVRESTSVTVEEEEEANEETGGRGEWETKRLGEGETRGKDETLCSPSLPVALPTSHTVTASPRHRVSPSQAVGRRWLGVAALLVVGAAAAFGIYQFISQRQPGDGAGAPFREMGISRLTISGKATHAAISPDGKYVAYVTVDSEGDSLWVRHVAAPTSVRVAGPAPTEYPWVTFAPDGDSVYYLTLDRNKGEAALNRVPVLGGPSSVAAHDVGPVGFSPDGRQITFIRNYGDGNGLVVANADGTNERVLAERRQPEFFQGNWNAPAWSPDGKIIACPVRLSDERGQYETVVGVSVEDRSVRPLTSARWGHAGPPVWLADGSGLLVTADESATSPVQVWHISLKSGEATRVTNDLNNYSDLSLTADASRLAAVQTHAVSSVWVAPDADAGRAKQIASEVGWIAELAWTPDGRIVYRSNAGGGADIWVMDVDGSNTKQLTSGARASRGLTVSPDGRYIFFASDRAKSFNIWRVDSDGSNLTQLTSGEDEYYPHATPDGRWVVYQRAEKEPRLWKVPAEGGAPVRLTETKAVRPAVSPDGALVAYHYLDSEPEKSRWSVGIVSSAGGQRLKRFDFPPTVVSDQRFVRWPSDSRSIAYANSPGGLADIWAQPLDGSPPKQLTNFKADRILAFDWSPDGRTLAFVRHVETSDVVLIEQRQR